MDGEKISPPPNTSDLEDLLKTLNLAFMHSHFESPAKLGARKGWGHVDYLQALARGEADLRRDRSVELKIRLARFPVKKTIEQFLWSWPTSINRAAVQDLFRLKFIEEKANVIFLGPVGVGKTHLATALGYAACLRGKSVLFTTAIDVINTLAIAQQANRLKAELKKYLSPCVLVLDELGYLPIDKHGADLLFQIISLRYEQGSIIFTSNRAYKHWPQIFNNDSTLTSAILDRVLHHAQTILIEGKSFRMKDQIET